MGLPVQNVPVGKLKRGSKKEILASLVCIYFIMICLAVLILIAVMRRPFLAHCVRLVRQNAFWTMRLSLKLGFPKSTTRVKGEGVILT